MKTFYDGQSGGIDPEIAPYVPPSSRKHQQRAQGIHRVEQSRGWCRKFMAVLHQNSQKHAQRLADKLKVVSAYQEGLFDNYDRQIAELGSTDLPQLSLNDKEKQSSIRSIEEIYESQFRLSAEVESYLQKNRDRISSAEKELLKATQQSQLSLKNKANIPEPQCLRSQTLIELQKSTISFRNFLHEVQTKLQMQLQSLEASEQSMLDQMGAMLQSRISYIQSSLNRSHVQESEPGPS